MESFQGTIISTQNLKDCEFLKDAEIFSEDVELHRNGHNRYRVFRLTQKGLQFAKELQDGLMAKQGFEAKILVS